MDSKPEKVNEYLPENDLLTFSMYNTESPDITVGLYPQSQIQQTHSGQVAQQTQPNQILQQTETDTCNMTQMTAQTSYFTQANQQKRKIASPTVERDCIKNRRMNDYTVISDGMMNQQQTDYQTALQHTNMIAQVPQHTYMTHYRPDIDQAFQQYM